MKLTIKPINILRSSLKITDNDRKNFKKELGVIQILTSVMSFTFLFFFMYLDKFNYETVLSIFTFVTSDFFKIIVVSLSIYIFFGSIVLKNYTYTFSICLFLFAHFLFIHVLNDQYSIDSAARKTFKSPPKNKIHYSIYWNVG